MKHGSLEIKLPDDVLIKIGVTQEDKKGVTKIKDDYCWVITSRDKRSIVMDSEYCMNLQFEDDSKLVVVDDKIFENGENYRRLEVV